MSRIGRAPIAVPTGVEVKITDHHILVKGSKGQLERELHPAMTVQYAEDTISVLRPTDSKLHRALHGLTRALINNMVKGVTDGFKKELELVGLGYRVEAKPRGLLLNVGFSHSIFLQSPPGIKIEVPKANNIIVSGCDKELVGQVAAEIRAIRKPEPYKGKGLRYSGETVKTKAGKTAK
ncbi:50S ribosomal protein L6 [candidate division KSB1 bacterium]|nr:MAG: 50S ribosomal protein L6 [candidate division KSB1 bacterium]